MLSKLVYILELCQLKANINVAVCRWLQSVGHLHKSSYGNGGVTRHFVDDMPCCVVPPYRDFGGTVDASWPRAALLQQLHSAIVPCRRVPRLPQPSGAAWHCAPSDCGCVLQQSCLFSGGGGAAFVSAGCLVD